MERSGNQNTTGHQSAKNGNGTPERRSTDNNTNLDPAHSNITDDEIFNDRINNICRSYEGIINIVRRFEFEIGGGVRVDYNGKSTSLNDIESSLYTYADNPPPVERPPCPLPELWDIGKASCASMEKIDERQNGVYDFIGHLNAQHGYEEGRIPKCLDQIYKTQNLLDSINVHRGVITLMKDAGVVDKKGYLDELQVALEARARVASWSVWELWDYVKFKLLRDLWMRVRLLGAESVERENHNISRSDNPIRGHSTVGSHACMG